GMSGFSYGAITTQGVSGQTDRTGKQRFTDSRIKAAVIMSPSIPQRGPSPDVAFGNVEMPWMLMTGTHDIALIGVTDIESRLAVYEALPPGNKYEIVLHEAEHTAFSQRQLPGDKLARNPNHHRVILGLSTAFWDAFLKEDEAALEWLNGDVPTAITEPNDRW